ncbi:helix-turn-helix domain-containing protein [Dethiobacter alkaliphilus]|uniref:DNA binding domain protein, excisionase family n=1 Tax=Dethiobacter alkaliphilus AHT 1 TaxID=555088 RepID=C0GGP4_DETAL|nr:helix-turn-helix domain-containing protein [Dethiobacter alkaliphilus]EEG77485.1 DNA binding domain protein, excisionase family [Dethiobacter alkaliphilus AHT 1]
MNKDQNIEKWSSMDIIIDYLGVSRETVLQWINNRNMPAHKVGRLWKFKISEVDEWIRSGGAAQKNDHDVTE